MLTTNQCNSVVLRACGRGFRKSRVQVAKFLPAILIFGHIQALSAGGGSSDLNGQEPLFLFMEPQDISDVRGRIQFVANSLQPSDDWQVPPGRKIGLFEIENGYVLFTSRNDKDKVDDRDQGSRGSLYLYRYTTADFRHYQGGDVVLKLTPEMAQPEMGERHGWNSYCAMGRNPETGEYLFLAYATGKGGVPNGANLFLSRDGIQWRQTNHFTPNYYDHDCCGIVWSSQSQKWVICQTSYQGWQKHIPDNIGDHKRRVMTLRTSSDAAHWQPIIGFNREGPWRDESEILAPDEFDGPDDEFYMLHPFKYGDRYVGFMGIYAPSPAVVNPNPFPPGSRKYKLWSRPDLDNPHGGRRKGPHGPHLVVEWWVADNPADLQSWRRPYRDFEATPRGGGAGSHLVRFEDKHFDATGNSLPLWRLAGAHARSNAEFSTPTFNMPQETLVLNANCAWHGNKSSVREMQPYIMVEIRDEDGQVIEGFEKEKCILTDADGLRLPLEWGGKYTTSIVGRRVSLRFYFRDATIYAVDYRQFTK